MPEADLNQNYFEATVRTAGDLFTVAKSIKIEELSELELPEIEWLSSEVARVVPAGNVPGMILSSLASVGTRRLDKDESSKHIDILFKGVKQSLNKAVYGAIFGGPAAVLYGYQQLLRLAGIKPEEAFREGTWQFYLEFALREDSAHHTNETVGFQEFLQQQCLNLTEADRLAAWMLAVASIVQQLPDMLANEWRERMILCVMADAATAAGVKDAATYRGLYKQWERQRPYINNAHDSGMTFATYRQRVFDAFWKPYLKMLGTPVQEAFTRSYTVLEKEALAAYQQQMTWLAYLDPSQYRETRVPYDISQAQIGVISHGRYFLVNLVEMTDPQAARQAAAAILADARNGSPANLDDVMVRVTRAEHATLRKRLSAGIRKEVEALRFAPVLINWDERISKRPLAEIRQTKRGLGDHALTLMRTDDSMVFDQSHVFFDGVWGAAIAQIMTNEAIDWAREILQIGSVEKPGKVPYSPGLRVTKKALDELKKYELPLETSAENDTVALKEIVKLRKLLKMRSDLAQVTVNDLLILYRGLHVQLYQPSQKLQQLLNILQADPKPDSKAAYEAVMDSLNKLQNKNPAILIPIDASQHNPRDRVFPTTFRNPIVNFMEYHNKTLGSFRAYQNSRGAEAAAAFERFRVEQTTYLRMLGGFGQILTKYKEIALMGESTSNTVIELLGYLPDSLRKLLDNIPSRFDVLNEVIKGEEVFSNTGKVARESTLRRFITAKDDNQQKTLCWGVITDDKGVVRISLRDFRPHVKVLHEYGMGTLADLIVQDYLDSYVKGFNKYIAELREITVSNPVSLGI